MTKPKVSVIMSTYNRADTFLTQAIQSVVSQSFTDWELIVVDDCSTDGTARVVEGFSRDDARVRYLCLTVNSGSDTKPKNMGLQASRGELVAYLDDDCEWYPFHLEMMVKEFDADPELGLLYCDAVTRDEAGKFGQAIALDFDAQFLLMRNYIDTNCAMHRRSLAFAVGGFDESLPKFIDWNMWVRMMKWGAVIRRIPVMATVYSVHAQSKSARVPSRSWRDPVSGMMMFEPTFDPAGCYIKCDYLPSEREPDPVTDYNTRPRVAIYTITYDRLAYTQEMFATLQSSTAYPFDWFVFDNGSSDDTPAWLRERFRNNEVRELFLSPDNQGITRASNRLLDMIAATGEYEIIIKVDNDAKFMTKNWLETLVDLWRRNHRLYMSPYIEGLVDNPGGAPRVGVAHIGPYLVEVTRHIGGIVAAVDARAYATFRFSDQFLHGNQDSEASKEFRRRGYMPCYIPQHRVLHNDTTAGQKARFPEYFERRKKEKTQAYVGKEGA